MLCKVLMLINSRHTMHFLTLLFTFWTIRQRLSLGRTQFTFCFDVFFFGRKFVDTPKCINSVFLYTDFRSSPLRWIGQEENQLSSKLVKLKGPHSNNKKYLRWHAISVYFLIFLLSFEWSRSGYFRRKNMCYKTN